MLLTVNKATIEVVGNTVLTFGTIQLASGGKTPVATDSSSTRDPSVVNRGSGSRVHTRRSALGLAAAVTVALPGLSHAESETSVIFEERAGESGPVDLRYAPQFYLGNPDAGFRIELAWSIHCQFTRLLYNNGLGEFIKNVRVRNDALIVFHHLSRTRKEMALSELLLSLDPTYYGPMCLVALGFFSEKGYDPTKNHLAALIRRGVVPRDPEFDSDAAHTSTALLNVYLSEKERITKTPSLFTNGKWEVGAAPSTLEKILEEAGYDS